MGNMTTTGSKRYSNVDCQSKMAINKSKLPNIIFTT